MFDYFTLDGVNNTDPNFNTYVVLPSIDALQEFKVQTGVYPAEFGHNATQINVLTKSGGNQYHGALFEFLRNDVLDAKPYSFTSQSAGKNPFKWNQFGFELDGPVRIPKIFDGQRQAVLHGELRSVPATAELSKHLLRANSRDVQWRLQRLSNNDLRSQ